MRVFLCTWSYITIITISAKLAGVLPTQASQTLVGQPKSPIVGQNNQMLKSPPQIRFSNQPTLVTNTAQLISGNHQAMLNHFQVTVRLGDSQSVWLSLSLSSISLSPLFLPPSLSPPSLPLLSRLSLPLLSPLLSLLSLSLFSLSLLSLLSLSLPLPFLPLSLSPLGSFCSSLSLSLALCPTSFLCYILL